ncbi:MAG: undecaprenyl-phosphate glucose phosphotransferase [Calditrichia bacterium]
MQSKRFRKNLLIPALKLILDALTIEFVFLFSFYLRFYSFLTEIFPVTKGYPPLRHYLIASVIFTIIYLALFGIFKAYRSRYLPSLMQDLTSTLKTCFVGILFAMSGAFLYRGFSYSRLTLLLVFVNSLVFFVAQRFLFHRLRAWLMRKGYGKNSIVLAGSADQIRHFLKQLQRRPSPQLNLLGYFCSEQLADATIPWLGDEQKLTDFLDRHSVDGILLAYSSTDQPHIVEISRMVEGKNVELFYLPDLLDLITSRTAALEVAGIPLLRIKAVAFSGWQGFLKRSFDIIVSVVALILLSPLFLLLALAVKLTSKGPVFYRQKRVGLDGHEFTMFKFRSMRVDAEKETGPVWAKANDPRTTPIGKFLRRTSLDELPQLYNVLIGDMSLVGPRPERKVFVDQFQAQIPKYAERHRVRSGMTGWAQVNGLRGQSPIEDRTRYDIFYIENWSLWFDIKIILLTFFAIIRGENAY